MPRELIKFKGSLGEVTLLKDAQEQYSVEAYWLQGDFYRKLIETDNRALADEIFLRAAENLS
jgi:hypothetical protein